MASDDAHDPLVVREDPGLHARLERLAAEGRMVFLAGLPGTGKSLLVHQLAHLAHAAGRDLHLLQWDVVRPRFEASRAGARYPIVRGVTHGVIRIAAGLWARHALAGWHSRHPEAGHLLIGETPLVGHRFIELARRIDDAAEPLLAREGCRFVIPVPSREVRAFLEVERDRRIRQPAHDREREDAPPAVLRALWDDLVEAGRALGVDRDRAPGTPTPYDPALYERVYRRVLRHRRVESLPLDRRLATAGRSVYDFAVSAREVLPAPDEADRFIREVEREHPRAETVQREIERWYVS